LITIEATDDDCHGSTPVEAGLPPSLKLRRTIVALREGGQTRLSFGGSKDPPLQDENQLW